MSEYIPFEVQIEIIKKLPVKSLIQLRSVSKPWKSLIDSSDFITFYGVRQIQPHRLIVRYEDPLDTTKIKYISFVDDSKDPIQQEFSPTIPVLAKLLKDSIVVGTSHGLLCLYGNYTDSGKHMAVLWNPSIRKSIGVEVPGGVSDRPYDNVFGFGVCPVTSDPTIVKITFINMCATMHYRFSVPWQVQVFTLSSGTWRIIPSSNLPRGSIEVTSSQVVIDRFLYWAAFVRIATTDGGFQTKKLIVSFDLTTKEFKVIDLPDTFSHRYYTILSISKVKESLVVLEYNVNSEKQVCAVWMLEEADTNSFTKLFTVNTPDASIKRVLGFKKSGKPIMETFVDNEDSSELGVYEPCSDHINNLGILGKCHSFFVSSYMETLLLLDQSDGAIYSNIK